MVQMVLIFLIGLCAGLTTSLTGASAVMITVPILSLLLHFSMLQAIGTSLMVDTLASVFISYTYYKHGNTDVKSGIWVILGSIIGAQLGVMIAVLHVPERSLGGLFGVFLIIMGAAMWRQGLNKEVIACRFGNTLHFKNHYYQITASMILGFFVGVITGMLGAGGGIMILLILIFILKFSLQKAIGTSTFMMAITALSGTTGYGYQGELNILVGLILASGAVAAGIIGAKFANRVKEDILTKVAAVIFIGLGVTMLMFCLYEWNRIIL